MLKLGRQPNDPRKPRVRLTARAGAPLVAPPSADWMSAVRSWPILGNDRVGDCTCAGAGHTAQAVNRYGQAKDAPVTEAAALTMYRAISGYDPARPSTDVGATLQDALGYWRKTGIGGNKLTAFAEVNAQDLNLVRACIAIFGSVYTGFNCPTSALDQFDAGKPWTVAARSAIDGGHCVRIGAYDPLGFTCVTWGRVQRMDLAFYQRYFDEVWVPIDLDWVTAAGTSPAGLDTDALNADFVALTGQPGPFPRVTPPVTPPPVTNSADKTLAAAFDAWRTAKNL